jgi:uncharacterized membrane protein
MKSTNNINPKYKETIIFISVVILLVVSCLFFFNILGSDLIYFLITIGILTTINVVKIWLKK